jgi:hypothetical protein
MLKAQTVKMATVVVGLLLIGAVVFNYTKLRYSMPDTMANMAPPAGGGASAASAVHAAPHAVGGDLSPSELIPSGGLGAAWAAANPSGLGDLKGQNFLSAGALIGTNTVGQSKKNASHDLRIEYPVKRTPVGPWGNSVIEGPDVYRRGLGDIGLPGGA